MVGRSLFAAAWIVAFPLAIGAIAVGLILMTDETAAASDGTRPVGRALLVCGMAISILMVRWFRRIRRGADAVRELPAGASFDRVRLAVGTGPYSASVRSDGPFGLWLDVGATDVLLHVGLRYRAIVNKSQLRPRIRRRWRGSRLELAFDPPARLIRWGRPLVTERILVPVPEEPGGMTLLLGSSDPADGALAPSRPVADDPDGRFEVVWEVVGLVLLVAAAPWVGFVIGRGIARSVSADPRPGGLGVYVVAAAIAWILVGLLLWGGARRDWYDADEAGGWLALIAPILASAVAIPVGFLVTI